MTVPIKIRGELTPDPHLCKFHLDGPLLDGDWMVVFDGPEETLGSALPDALFAVEGVVQVCVRGGEITVRKSSSDPWPELAGRIVPGIRDALTGGVPPISDAALDRVRNAPVDEIGERVARLFEEHINPALASHGGFARLVRVEDRDVYLEMGGGCQGCAASKATLRNGIETAIRQVVPQVREVIDVTDHTAGVNPYYSE